MIKYPSLIISILMLTICNGQPFDTSKYEIRVEYSEELSNYFTNDPVWRGADGAASVDLENGKVVWLFSDSFICSDSSGSRKMSNIIRNSIAIQDGYDLKMAPVQFYWDNSKKKPEAFFHKPGKSWFWPGDGVLIKDKLLIFLMKVDAVKSGLGFEISGWYAVLVSNPNDDPSTWEMEYIEGPETFGTIAGSGAVIKDESYIYAYGAVEPSTHEVYLLRWNINDAYTGNLSNPEWWTNEQWTGRKTDSQPLFTGSTEYSVHYDKVLKKYIQIQSFGFGEAKIGMRISDSLNGRWTEPYLFYTPATEGVKEPFLYAAKAHPELTGDGVYITYNVNSFEFDELMENQGIYFPKFILLKIAEIKEP